MASKCKYWCGSLALILVAMMTPGRAMADFTWDLGHVASVNAEFEIEAFHTLVTNTSATLDTVTVNMVKNVPATWVASLCESSLCYPPFVLDIDLVLGAGQTTELIIDMTPVGLEGTGTTLITLVSRNNPAFNRAATFTVLTPTADVLYVSGDGGGAEALMRDAITANGLTSTTWSTATMGKAAADDLSRFATVIWGVGASLGTVSTADLAAMSSYVTGGGQLLVSGANLAYSLGDPTSPFFDAGAHAALQSTMSVAYVATGGSTDFVVGGAGDPAFPGATFNINGGDGTSSNASPDVIAPVGSGVASLAYSGGGTALVVADSGLGKTAYAGFDPAGIADAAGRAAFVAGITGWFAGTASAVGEGRLPGLLGRPAVWPNPFNPRTNIRFEVGGQGNVPATVTIYDLRGRSVRHLFRGTVSPGVHTVVWNGRGNDDRAVATGLYLARVRVPGDEQVVKLTLAQ